MKKLKIRKEKKRKKKKSTVFLLFCVSVDSFCDELTVVFRSFVCSFSTNSYAFKWGEGRGLLGSVSFFVRLSGTDLCRGREEPGPPREEEGTKRTICTTGKGENTRKKKLKTE